MKTKLLILLCFSFFDLNAQTTHQIQWTFDINSDTTPLLADLTIEVGDTVEWIWNDNVATHTVTNKAGSTETFDSGSLSGMPNSFSKTFNTIGTNDYQCDFHPLTMYGTITVTAPLGIEDFSLKSFLIKPNPSSLNLNIELPNNITNAKVEVFDVLGKRIYNNEITTTPIDISSWSRGVYLVRVSTSNATHTKRFVKQ
ncbi:T9SS C-terminal target domain-containing protein [Flavobacteriaceae bacterium PRS1]|nr:T9SS C-terminal target domain-containing protein [Flavobacteriaceae bacterium PRS1]